MPCDLFAAGIHDEYARHLDPINQFLDQKAGKSNLGLTAAAVQPTKGQVNATIQAE